MKRAYIASQLVEYVVVAESEEAAQKLAVKAARDDYMLRSADCFDLAPMTHLPALYRDDQDLVHNDADEDITVADAAKLPGGYNHIPAPSEAP